MKVCPECKITYDDSKEICDADGTDLILAEADLQKNPEPRSVQEVSPDEATAMFDLEAMEDKFKEYEEQKEAKLEEEKKAAQESVIDPDATGEIDLAELEKQRKTRNEENAAAVPPAGSSLDKNDEKTQISRRRSLSGAHEISTQQKPDAKPPILSAMQIAIMAGFVFTALVATVGTLVFGSESGSLLTVTTTPPGAIVALDGAEIGRSPMSTHIAPGSYALALRLDGYEEFKEIIEIPEEGLPFLQPLKAIPGWRPPARPKASAISDSPTEANADPKEGPNQKTATEAERPSANLLAEEIQQLVRQGNREKAFAAVKRMLLLYPEDARIDSLFQLVGEIGSKPTSRERGKPSASKSKKEKVGLGGALSSAGSGDSSKTKTKESRRLYQAGEGFVRRSQYKDAKKAFKDAIRMDPSFFMPHRAIARLYQRENNIRQTKYHLERYLRLGGPDGDRRVRKWLDDH
jgi:tetratricopeptide (TPR) repeat protein